MININSLETNWLRQAELCPRHHDEEKKRQTEEEVGRLYQKWTGMDFASSTRAVENWTRSKGIVANSSVVPRRPSKVMG